MGNQIARHGRNNPCQPSMWCTPSLSHGWWKGATQVWFTSTEEAFGNSSFFLHGCKSQNVTLHSSPPAPRLFSVQYKGTSNPGLGQKSVIVLPLQ